jgi:hypothetical protein
LIWFIASLFNPKEEDGISNQYQSA